MVASKCEAPASTIYGLHNVGVMLFICISEMMVCVGRRGDDIFICVVVGFRCCFGQIRTRVRVKKSLFQFTILEHNKWFGSSVIFRIITKLFAKSIYNCNQIKSYSQNYVLYRVRKR